MKAAIPLIYILLRIVGDFWWRTVTPWAAYTFEILFVIVVGYVYRKRLIFRLPVKVAVSSALLSLAMGFSIYRLIVSAGLQVPFDFNSMELLFLLLVLGPILEEFIFRMALWEPIADLFKKKSDAVLILTTALFSVGHLQAFWSVPLEYRPFVLIQGLYVILLGLGCGYGRMRTGSISGAIYIHVGFNLGFFLASLA